MRVVHFLHRIRLEDGGVVRATLDLCAALASRGHDVTLVTSDATDVPDSWKNGEPGCPRVEETPPLVGPLKLLSRYAKRSLELRLKKADLVHIHEFWQPAAAQAALIAQRIGTPYVVSAHGMLDDWSMAQSSLKKQVFLKLVGNRVFRGASTVHCAASREATQARHWVPLQHTDVVPLAVDLDPYRTLPDRDVARNSFPGDPARPTVAYLGRLHSQKGIEKLIEAAAKLKDAGKPVDVLVAGAGKPEYEAELREMVERLGLTSLVHFVGHVAGEDKVRLLRAADMLVLPSYQESFGLVLVEAMACGTPVVTTKAVAIWPDLYAAGVAVIIDEPDATAVAGAVTTLAEDANQRRDMGNAGRRWVFDHLNPEHVLDQFDGLYGRLVNGEGMPTARKPMLVGA